MRRICEETTDSSCEEKRYEFYSEKQDSIRYEFEQNSSKIQLTENGK